MNLQSQSGERIGWGWNVNVKEDDVDAEERSVTTGKSYWNQLASILTLDKDAGYIIS